MLKAGYIGDVGELLPGVIHWQKTYWESPDKITELIVGDNTERWLNAGINKTWRAGILASEVARDLVKNLPFTIGELSLNKEITYTKGKTFSCTIKRALEEIARDTGSKLHLSRGMVYLRPYGKGTQKIVYITPETGLIGSPQILDENEKTKKKRWKIQSLLNYKIESDSIVKVESKTLNNLCIVKSGEHILSGDDFLTEIEVELY
jgi:hypothetical protein